MRRLIQSAAIAAAMIATVVRAACPYMSRFAPVAVLNTGEDASRIELVTPPVTQSVHWKIGAVPLTIGGARACSGLDIQLYDDGTHGDRTANDGIFSSDSVRFDSTCAVQPFADVLSYAPDQGVAGVSIVFLGGTITVTGPSGQTVMNNPQLFLRVLDASLFSSLNAIVPLNSRLQSADHALNVMDDAYVPETGLGSIPDFLNTHATVQGLIMSLYSGIHDDYDFIELQSTATPVCDSSGAAGVHYPAQAAWTGTGQTAFNQAASYGSAGRLLGTNLIDANVGFSSSYLHFHETTHTWAADLDPALGLSSPPGEVGGFGPGHWALSNSIAGNVGGCYWKDNGDGTFASLGRIEQRGRFSELEMYLMGLIPAAEVPPINVALNTPQNFCLSGTKIVGPFVQVTIGDIIARHGVRTPGPDTSQKQFRMAVAITSQGRLLTPLEMTLYSRMAAKIQSNFASYSSGLGSLTTSLDFPGGASPFPMTNSASYAAGAPLAPGMIAFAEAPGITSDTEVASTNPWPPVLGGVHLEITDSQGQTLPVPIYYVAANTMAFLIPGSASLGRASVKLTTASEVMISGKLDVDRISPGLYAANAGGSGVAAGFWVRQAGNGTISQDFLFTATQSEGSRTAVPVDMGPAGDQVYLSLYGTGFRGAARASATVGGVSVPVYGFAAVEAYQGEDVVNLGPLPRSLAGSGEAPVAVIFDLKAANVVTVNFR